jgi:hypothetical protein
LGGLFDTEEFVIADGLAFGYLDSDSAVIGAWDAESGISVWENAAASPASSLRSLRESSTLPSVME